MAEHAGAPVSAVLQLQPSVTPGEVVSALSEWLQKVHDVELQSAEHGALLVEWRSTDEDPFACQLVASDSSDQARRTITVLCDDIGTVAYIEETPFAAADAPHSSMDLSQPIQLLLALLMPMAITIQDLVRGEVNDLQAIDASELVSHLSGDLAPGLLIAVVAADGALTTPQSELLDDLAGLAVIGTVPSGATLFSEVGISTQPRAGSVVCLSRSAEGLDAQVIASTSLRTKLDSARRLVIRRQLAAPVPFDLERRRSGAMTRLLAGGSGVDLPTALQLLDDENQRANDLGNRVKELELLLELAYDEQDSALGELDNAQSQVRYLQKAFKELGEVPIVETEDDDDWVPESMRGRAGRRAGIPALPGHRCDRRDVRGTRRAPEAWDLGKEDLELVTRPERLLPGQSGGPVQR